MDAVALLLEDHASLRNLLGQLADTTSRGVKKRHTLLAEVEANIMSHTPIGEEIFYPAFKAARMKSDDDKMYFEALEEHRAAGDRVLPDLLKTDPSGEQFSGRAKVLKELIEHHAGEEEKDTFPRAKKLMDRDKRAELGQQMQQRRAKLLRRRVS